MIELHCHLDGAITVDIAKKIAELQNIKLPSENDKELERLLSVPESCESLTEFLKCFELPCSLLQTKEGLTEAVKLILQQKLSEGLRYLELRYAPQLHCKQNLSQEDSILAVLDGIKQSSLHCNLILCCMRGENVHPANFKTVELAKKYLVQDGGVVALDLAGAEALYPISDYCEEFEMAKNYKIPFTIHAGEAAGSESIKKALILGAARIGHGVRLEEDPELVEYVIQHHIPLEMCPTSNRQTKTVTDMKNYPFRKYLEKGIKVTVNTDDPAICRTSIVKEFEYLRKNYGLTKKEEKLLLSNAIDAAFTTETVKTELKKSL